MDIHQEKWDYTAMLVAENAITQEQCDTLKLSDGMNMFYSDHLASTTIDCINWGWSSWLKAKAQAVPEWFDYTKQSPQMDGNYQIFIKGEQITAKWVSRFGFADPIEGDALRQELITHWAMQPQSPKAQELTHD